MSYLSCKQNFSFFLWQCYTHPMITPTSASPRPPLVPLTCSVWFGVQERRVSVRVRDVEVGSEVLQVLSQVGASIGVV